MMPSPPPQSPDSARHDAEHPDPDVPRILGDFEALTGDLPESHVGTHAEPDLDVLLLVVAGDGIIGTTGHALPLAKGTILWLPHGSSRSLAAGDDGMSYLTLHRRRPGMRIKSRQEVAGADPT